MQRSCYYVFGLSLLITLWFAIQIAGWGADGVIIGSAIVRQLGEAASPEEGLKRVEEYAKNMKAAMPWDERFHASTHASQQEGSISFFFLSD